MLEWTQYLLDCPFNVRDDAAAKQQNKTIVSLIAKSSRSIDIRMNSYKQCSEKHLNAVNFLLYCGSYKLMTSEVKQLY